MNDRFRFRVWFTPDYQEPEMIYDAEQTYDNRCRCQGSFYHESFGEILEDKNCVVMQCTGLKDKNGKLIYEGDVLDVIGFVLHEVVWNQESCGFELQVISGKRNLDDWLDDTTGENRNHRIEIKGNIYQNPELLEDNNG